MASIAPRPSQAAESALSEKPTSSQVVEPLGLFGLLLQLLRVRLGFVLPHAVEDTTVLPLDAITIAFAAVIAVVAAPRRPCAAK